MVQPRRMGAFPQSGGGFGGGPRDSQTAAQVRLMVKTLGGVSRTFEIKAEGSECCGKVWTIEQKYF